MALESSSGDEVHPFYDMGDLLFPKFPWKPRLSKPEAVMDSIKSLKLRPADVIICGYGKSGTHWLWQLVHLLLSEKSEYPTVFKHKLMLEALDQEDMDSLPSPRVLNTHLLLDCLPDHLFTCGCKVIHILRNPKDIAVSAYHFLRSLSHLKQIQPWDDFIRTFLTTNVVYYTWFHYIRGMEDIEAKHPGKILRVAYEDLKQDTRKELERIAKFIGRDYDEHKVDEVVTKCSLDKLKDVDEKHNKAFNEMCFREKPSVYRKGIVGDWKSHFTVEQSELFDKVYKEKMKGSQLQLKYYL
ncbi:hypothetical protein ScPMuIL_015670 [Solemya velum]